MIFNRYILKDILTQFILMVCVIGSILVVSQFIRLSEILLNFGFSLENLFLPVLFVVFPILSFVLPLSYFFAVFISFSRFSTDGEWVAAQAAGYSLRKVTMPLTALGLVIGITGSIFSLWMEPWGQREINDFLRQKVQQELDSFLDNRLKPGVFIDDFLGFTIYAEKVSADKRRLSNVMLTSGSKDSQSNGNFKLFAPEAEIRGSVKNADLTLMFRNSLIYSDPLPGTSDVIKMDLGQWDLIRLFERRFFLGEDSSQDFRSYSPQKLIRFIQDEERLNPGSARGKKAKFLLHHRASLPLVSLSFCWLALVFAVQSSRTPRSLNTVFAVSASVLSYLLFMFSKTFADREILHPVLAAWVPHALLLPLVGAILWQKNKLPPAESVWFFFRNFRQKI